MMAEHRLPPDWQARQKALDISRSCIVQAPAGSGKTELLVQRVLALLAVADRPEEILAITFTRKAAGEMTLRLLQALEGAQNPDPPGEPHDADTWRRARAALARDRAMGWNLLTNPSRLQLMTIDSFCAYLTRRMPWLSRFGEQPRVTDDPSDLYLQAADALLSRLEKGAAVHESIERLLPHLDNRLKLLRELIVDMLGRRDQWLRHLVSQRTLEPRQLLETGLQVYVSSVLQHLYTVMGDESYRELRTLANVAATNLSEKGSDHPFAVLLEKPEDHGSLRQWLALAHLALTTGGEVRKSVNRSIGFPADARTAPLKERALTLLGHLRENPNAVQLLRALRQLPATAYTDGQWQVLKALIDLLPLSVVELQGVFRLRGQVDFIEISGAAHAALGSAMNPEELLLQLDGQLSHILVDEFQDTSYAQYDLLRCLTAGWVPDDGRTLFVVGDPMQSIYRFREAEVGLYLRVCRRGLESLPMERIVLNTNFRSSKALVDWVNANLGILFPAEEDEVNGAVSFAHSTAFDQSGEPAEVSMSCFVERQDVAEAEAVVALVRQARDVDPDGTVAILARSRNHLPGIVAALKNAGLAFQAQDVDPLTARAAVQDILSLTRALLHPADRVAWLAVFRAPWCGLTLHDLTGLCCGDARRPVWQLLTELPEQTELFDPVSEDGRHRLHRILPALERALDNRGRVSLRRLVESTWLSVGGPACVSESDLLDVRQVFALLDELGEDLVIDDLEARLTRLFATPDPQAGPELQVMTIHKAKGLEFDTVILPGLGRGIRASERALLRWLEHPDYELLLAPIPPYASSQEEPIYRAIGHILKQKDELETLRLLYVAATRAKKRLHLLGHVTLNKDNLAVPRAGSLLSIAWPGLGQGFSEHLLPAPDVDPISALRPLPLKRLPGVWQLPALQPPFAEVGTKVKRASEGAYYRDETIRSRRSEEGRVVGTLVHLWLERLAAEGLDLWTEQALSRQREQFRFQLNAHGIPQARITSCVSMVETCLVNVINSDRGRWLLRDHRQSASELALHGVVNGQLVRATIDRTFVDEEGVRWVVDYKTTGPAPGDSREAFLASETQRYAHQLQMYAALIGQLDPDRQIRQALYFPLFDGWALIED